MKTSPEDGTPTPRLLTLWRRLARDPRHTVDQDLASVVARRDVWKELVDDPTLTETERKIVPHMVEYYEAHIVQVIARKLGQSQ